MSFLIDTNVLISSYDVTEKQQECSYTLMEKAMNGDIEAVLAHQNLLEYIAVVTDKKRVEHPLSPEEALVNIDIYSSFVSVISPKPTTIALFKKLLKEIPVKRAKVFDLYLAATALDHGITQICTWNTNDFDGIHQVKALTPEQIIEQLPK